MNELLLIIFYCHNNRKFNEIVSLLGEFGSVMEGHLRQPNGTTEKVAVKTMKCEFFMTQLQH